MSHFRWLQPALLIFILITAFVLRFYNAFEIPFTHDELSAWYRLRFDNFHDLIEFGVMKNDFHPAGVQVFLYYWTKLVGTSEFAVKLPFITMGLGAVLLAYLVAKNWYGNTCALLVAAFMATLQYTVMYSQIARPYASGLFWCLALVYSQSLFLFQHKRGWPVVTVLILSGVICTYNHHFSLLFAGMVLATGLCFLTKENYKTYIIACLLIALLYIPHLPVLFYQMKIGGVGGKDGWLGKPTPYFFIDYPSYVFQFSKVLGCMVGLLFMYGLLSFYNGYKTASKYRIIALCWFLFPLLLGYFYSVYRNPVLQFSILIFSFPFLLIFLFSFLHDDAVKPAMRVILVIICMTIVIYTLVFNRKHYKLFYHQEFKEFVKQSKRYTSGINDDVAIYTTLNGHYVDYYLHENGFSSPFYTSFYEKLPSMKGFRLLLDTLKSQTIILNSIPLEDVQIAREYYPNEIEYIAGPQFDYWVFSKTPVKKNVSVFPFFESMETFDKKSENWNYENDLVKKIDETNSVYNLDSTKEWGPSFTANLAAIANNRHQRVFVEVNVKTDNPENAGMLVFSLTKGDKIIDWRASNAMDCVTKPAKWQKVYLAVPFNLFVRNKDSMKNIELKVFWWNDKKGNVLLDDFKVSITEGNPLVYWSFQDFAVQ